MPLLSNPGNIDAIVSGSFVFDFDIVENSYAVDNSGAGMSVSFSGSATCQSLLATDVYESTASTTVTITPQLT